MGKEGSPKSFSSESHTEQGPHSVDLVTTTTQRETYLDAAEIVRKKRSEIKQESAKAIFWGLLAEGSVVASLMLSNASISTMLMVATGVLVGYGVGAGSSIYIRNAGRASRQLKELDQK